jgi:hypothetical protein
MSSSSLKLEFDSVAEDQPLWEVADLTELDKLNEASCSGSPTEYSLEGTDWTEPAKLDETSSSGGSSA